MTISNKINVMFIAVGLVLAAVLTLFTAYREYHIALDRAVAASLARVEGHPELQLEIYRRSDQGLQRLLQGFLETPGIASAIARDGLGEVLAQRRSGGATGHSQMSFAVLRGDLSAVEVSLNAFAAEGGPAGTGLWAAWTDSDQPMYLTIPVFTAANAGRSGLTAYDFFVAPTDPLANASQRVIGYIQLSISRPQLLAAISPVVRAVFFWSVLLVAACAAGIALATRRITRDLTSLARLADEVASGNVAKPLEIQASGEIKDIADVLNSVIGGFTRKKQEIDVGQRLLNMKVDERTSQLSQRDEELTRAAEEISETRTRLQHLVHYDSLTALPNRRLFSEQLQLLLGLNERNRHTLALLFINLDNFKRINDSLGHEAGDQVLKEVARRLSECVRDSDPVGHFVQEGQRFDVSRLGGDEFTVVLNQLDVAESAAGVARRIVESLLAPMSVDGHELVVSPSIGIAIAPRDGKDVEGLLKAAGIAMHHAKDSLRDKFLYYNEHMDATGVGRLKLEADLRKAVERRELVLHYQPQVNTLTGAVSGAEALLRWQHPEHGMIPPFQFVPLAEEIGVIGELGDWVLTEAIRQVKEFDESGLKLPRVGVNVSPRQFTADFAPRVAAILAECEFAPERLELGLGERILVDEDRVTRDTLLALKELGVYLSVNDFGASEAPMSYLSRGVLDELKIDRSFVLDCDKSEESARLVTAIIAMAGSLELAVVAEGVETEEQYRLLIEKGANTMQGYWFSKPVAAEELKVILTPWHFVEQLQAIQG